MLLINQSINHRSGEGKGVKGGFCENEGRQKTADVQNLEGKHRHRDKE